jgi:hypothetical protein
MGKRPTSRHLLYRLGQQHPSALIQQNNSTSTNNQVMQLANYFFIVLCLFALLTLFLNGKVDPAILASTGGSTTFAAPAALEGFLQSSSSKNRLAGLSCQKYGGPSDKDAEEMVYWRDIPADNQHVSPFHQRKRAQYLTFEPDFGGWNNIRMVRPFL